MLPAFGERIIPVDGAIARRSAVLHVPDPRPVRDSLLAATALVHGLSVVTRNVADFAPTGAEVIDPWQVADIIQQIGHVLGHLTAARSISWWAPVGSVLGRSSDVGRDPGDHGSG